MSSQAVEPHDLVEESDADEAIDLVGSGGDVIACLEFKDAKTGVTEGEPTFLLFHQIS